MTRYTPPKVHRLRLAILNSRHLPARRIPARNAGRRVGELLYWAKRNGICAITEKGKAAFLVISLDNRSVWSRLVWSAMALGAFRGLNPRGVFTIADEVLEGQRPADKWMLEALFSLGGKRPIDVLNTPWGVEEVLNMLNRIKHGMFG